MNISVLNRIKTDYNDRREIKRYERLNEKRKILREEFLSSRKSIIILSSDCVGGRLMKDYDLPQLTPTVNNWYSGSDFIKICKDPDRYFSCNVVEKGKDENGNYVGKIDDVLIHFGHAHSYEEAVKKWNVGCKSYFRAKRKGNYEICVIMNDRNYFDENVLNDYINIPYRYKVLFVHKKEWNIDHTFYMTGEEKKEFVSTMTRFENYITTKRRYDRFDFYGWFLKILDSDSNRLTENNQI